MICFERRASTVLFNLLRAHEQPGPVLVPENVCGVVPLVLMKLGRSVELVDISLETLGMDHDRLLGRWADPAQPPPAALVYVRPYGYVGDTSALFAELRALRPTALIIDDRCLCYPDPDVALDENVDAVLFSTGYAKCVDLGYGGFAVTRETVPYAGQFGPYQEGADGHWASVLKTAVASASAISYEDSEWLDRRRPGPWEEHWRSLRQAEVEARTTKNRINEIYASGLPRSIQLDDRFNNWRFNLWVRSGREALDTLFHHGLFGSAHYASVAPLWGRPVSERCGTLAAHIVNLFNYRYVNEAAAGRIVEVLNRCGSALDPGPAVAREVMDGGRDA